MTTTITTDLIAQYERLVATIPGLDRKGATMPYTSLNGHMFSYLDAAGILALRLGEPDRRAFMERYGARLQEVHGSIQKEYVAVPHALFGRTDDLAPWFAASHAYVAALKPKETTRRR